MSNERVILRKPREEPCDVAMSWWSRAARRVNDWLGEEEVVALGVDPDRAHGHALAICQTAKTTKKRKVGLVRWVVGPS